MSEEFSLEKAFSRKSKLGGVTGVLVGAHTLIDSFFKIELETIKVI
jgi:hypothetical protein